MEVTTMSNGQNPPQIPPNDRKNSSICGACNHDSAIDASYVDAERLDHNRSTTEDCFRCIVERTLEDQRVKGVCPDQHVRCNFLLKLSREIGKLQREESCGDAEVYQEYRFTIGRCGGPNLEG